MERRGGGRSEAYTDSGQNWSQNRESDGSAGCEDGGGGGGVDQKPTQIQIRTGPRTESQTGQPAVGMERG